MGSVRLLGEDSHFASELNASGSKLVVVDFTASWLVLKLVFTLSLKSFSIMSI